MNSVETFWNSAWKRVSSDRRGRGARVASICLAIVLITLSATALLGALFSYQAGTATVRTTQLSDAFDDARYSVGAEESLERKYRLEPSPEVRAKHQMAARALIASLERARLIGTRADVDLIDEVLIVHKQYLQSIEHMFAAIDVGDAAEASKIDVAEVDSTFDAIETNIFAATASHRASAVVHMANLANVQKTVLVATPIVFFLGIGLLFFFWRILGSFQRSVAESAVREAAALGRSEKRFRSLVQHASDITLLCDSEGTVSYQSPAAESAWGYAAGQLLGQPIRELVHPNDQPALRNLWEQLQDAPRSTRSTELRLHNAAGDWRQTDFILTNLLQEDGVMGLVATVRDITERKSFEAQLSAQAFYDSLTGLPNRVLLRDRLDHALTRTERRHANVGLLFLDLDNFKQINDSLGHNAGDKLLTEAAIRLQACVRQENTVARLGGDEFVILLEQLNSDGEAVLVAERIAEEFRKPFSLEGRDFAITVSIGIAFGAGGQNQADNLLRDADVAMYRAKSSGRARYVIFNATMQTDVLARMELENDLRRAIEQGELRVYYQPVMSLGTGHVAEVEALVRWQHPIRGLVLPAEFIQVAEETGLIIPLGQWVLEEACRQVAAWQAHFPLHPPLSVSVNLSLNQFQQPALLANVKAALKLSGLAPSSLKLEITEGVIMRDVEATIATLWQFKALGIHLAVDDFGTGYSSLAYLKRLPLDVLKIDRSFVNGIGRNPEDTAIVQAIISMAKMLKLSITGEGIETTEQSDLLTSWNCDLGQGYLFARPLTAAKLTEFLQATDRSESEVKAA